jgi:FdhD protein
MPPQQPSQSVAIVAVRGTEAGPQLDAVAVEAPLQIRVRAPGPGPGGEVRERDVSITMRTPGAPPGGGRLSEDAELAVGFLFTEGMVAAPGDVVAVEQPSPELVMVTLRDGARVDWRGTDRDFYTTSACGVCGKRSIDALAATPRERLRGGPLLAPPLVAELPERLRAAQATFAATGGLHAAGLFSATGELLALREDVGRHNAVDKLLGARLLAGGLPAHGQILVVSGRASFELVQKARMAAVPIFVAVGAPSSLAVKLARDAGMTLCGFTRPGRCNVYSGAERLGLQQDAAATGAPLDDLLATRIKEEQGEESERCSAAQPRRGRSLRMIPSE